MNGEKTIAAACVAAVAACAAGWYAVPLTQSAKDRVDREAGVQTERARRLLHDYDAELAYRAIVSEQLKEQGIEVDPARMEELDEEYQSLHTALWSAYQPVGRRGDSVSPEKPNYGNIASAVRDGVRQETQMAEHNARLLDDAIAAAEAALAVSVGGESSRADAEAGRLKATAVYYKGLGIWAKARLKSLEADHARRNLRLLAIAAAEAAASTQLVAGSRVDEQIGRLTEEATALEAVVAGDRSKLASLDATIEDLGKRLAAAEARREEVTAGLERLKKEGVDFADPSGAERFGIRFRAMHQAFREVDREVHTLRHGDYASASIDHTGDYLAARYLAGGGEPKIEHGLAHYENDRAVLGLQVNRRAEDLTALRADIDRLARLRSSLQSREAAARQELEETTAAANEAFGELNRLEAEAFALQDTALRLMDQAAGAAEQASRNAEAWVGEARAAARDLSPETSERSAFGKRQRDGWMGGFIGSQEADARIAKAWLYYDRLRAARGTAGVLSSLPEGVTLAEADADAEGEKATQAHDAGVKEIELAMKVLEQAHGKVERSWTIGAQAAGATYLLALFGHPEYEAESLEAYRAAVKGREDQAGAEPFMKRIARLEKRK